MTRLMFRRNRMTAFARVLSFVVVVTFTMSLTGVGLAGAPKGAPGNGEPAEVVPAQAPQAQEEVVEEPAGQPLEESIEEVAPPADKTTEKPAEAAAVQEHEDEPAEEPKPDKDEPKDPSEDKPNDEPPYDPGGNYTTVSGNPAMCEGGLKLDPAASGEYTHMVGDQLAHVSITITENEDGYFLSWSSDLEVEQVIVKGGPGANIYAYGGATSGSGLHAPLNPNANSNKWPEISWVGICFTGGGGGGGPTEKGTICVYKFYDHNGDGIENENDGPLEGFTFQLDPGGATATTNVQGWASFPEVDYGAYTVTEQPKAGWQATTPGGTTQSVTLDAPSRILMFGNKPSETVTHTKTFELNITSSVAVDVDSYGVTYMLDGVEYSLPLSMSGGVWRAQAQVDDGAVISQWYFYAMVDGEKVRLTADGASETVTADVTNAGTFAPGVVHAYKYIDSDHDGADPVDPDDAVGANWTITLDGPGIGAAMSATTDDSGHVAFTGLLPGTYTVAESLKSNFSLVYPPSGEFSVVLTLADMAGEARFVNAGAVPSISVTKTVDPTTAAIGDTVTWHIAVQNDGPVTLTNVVLTDALLGIDESIGPLTVGQIYTRDISWVVTDTAPATVTNVVTAVGTSPFGTVSDTDTAVLNVIRPSVAKTFRLETITDLVPVPDSVEADFVVAGQTTTVPLVNQGEGVWLSAPVMLDFGTVIDSWAVYAVVNGTRTPALFTDTTDETLDPVGAAPAVVNTATFVPGTIVGSKLIDVDRDGDGDDVASPWAPGWAFTLNGTVGSTTSGEGGLFTFTGLLPGSYTVAEVASTQQAGLFVPIGATSQTIAVGAGQTVTLDPFVNQPVPASISLVKSVTPTAAAAGDTVTFTFTVTNTGPWTLTNVTLADALLPAAEAVSIPDLAPSGTAGDSFTFSVPYTIPADTSAGTITNAATVTGTDQFGGSVTDTDTAVVAVSQPFAPFTPGVTPTTGGAGSPFLPFTGGELFGLLAAAALAGGAGTYLRRRARR